MIRRFKNSEDFVKLRALLADALAGSRQDGLLSDRGAREEGRT